MHVTGLMNRKPSWVCTYDLYDFVLQDLVVSTCKLIHYHCTKMMLWEFVVADSL